MLLKKYRTYRNWMRELFERLVHIEDKINYIISESEKVNHLEHELKLLRTNQIVMQRILQEYIEKEEYQMEEYHNLMMNYKENGVHDCVIRQNIVKE